MKTVLVISLFFALGFFAVCDMTSKMIEVKTLITEVK